MPLADRREPSVRKDGLLFISKELLPEMGLCSNSKEALKGKPDSTSGTSILRLALFVLASEWWGLGGC